MTTTGRARWVAAPSIQRKCRAFVRVLQGRYGPRLVSVVLFGSAARGRQKPLSDIDLLVVADRLPKSRLDRHGQIRDLAHRVSETFAQRVSVVPLTSHEAQDTKPFYLGMLSGHEILFDQGHFFRGVLEQLKRRLAELGSRRYVEPDGAEYWVLKPDAKPGEAIVL